MAQCRVVYTTTAQESIRHLPPLAKPAIKLLIEQLRASPELGKPLHSELAGYRSARFQRWRVIYTLDRSAKQLVVHLVERRVSVYDTLRKLTQ